METKRAESAPPCVGMRGNDIQGLGGESPRSDPGPFTAYTRFWYDLVTADPGEETDRSSLQQADLDLGRVIQRYSESLPGNCCLCGKPFDPQKGNQIIKPVDAGKGREGVYLADKSYMSRQEGKIPVRACVSCRHQVEASMDELGPLRAALFRKHKQRKAAQRTNFAERHFSDRSPSSRSKGRRGVPIVSSVRDHSRPYLGDNKGAGIPHYYFPGTLCEPMDLPNSGRGRSVGVKACLNARSHEDNTDVSTIDRTDGWGAPLRFDPESKRSYQQGAPAGSGTRLDQFVADKSRQLIRRASQKHESSRDRSSSRSDISMGNLSSGHLITSELNQDQRGGGISSPVCRGDHTASHRTLFRIRGEAGSCEDTAPHWTLIRI